MSNISVHSAGDFTPSEVSHYWADRLPGMPQRGTEWRYHCELHGGTHDSFSVNRETGMWYCHSKCGRGGSMFDFEMLFSNSDFVVAANEVRRIVGRSFLRQVDREPEMKWGVPGWSHQYLRQRIEKIESENG